MNLKVLLSWAYALDPLAPAEGFHVRRVQSGQVPVLLATLPVTQLNYEDATVVTGGTYTYRVTAYNAVAGESPPADATVQVTVPAPPAPGPLTATVQAV